jgi:hypothetical protein
MVTVDHLVRLEGVQFARSIPIDGVGDVGDQLAKTCLVIGDH